MEPYEHHLSLATALAVGLLIGLEREQSKDERPGSAIGGVRTYPIFALVGALASLLEPVSVWLPLVALGGVFALVAISYRADVNRGEPDRGATSEISLVATYLLGALSTSKGVIEPMADRYLLVAGLGVAIAFLLSSKPFFHGLAKRVSRGDFYAATKFLIVAVIVVPLLPDRDFGPVEAINARQLGIMVVIISALSFAGYVAMRLWGAHRGLLLGAALGGLVSSTAVTLSMANRAKAEPKLVAVAASAIAVAWAIMLCRVGVLVAVINPPLLTTLALPLAAMVAATVVGLVLTFSRGEQPSELELANPFDLVNAVKVTLLFGAVLIASKAANHYLGSQGLYLASALGGATDVDAVTLSSSRLAHTSDALPVVAVTSIAIAVAVNTVVKTAMAVAVGGRDLGMRVTKVAVLVIVAGGLALAAVTVA